MQGLLAVAFAGIRHTYKRKTKRPACYMCVKFFRLQLFGLHNILNTTRLWSQIFLRRRSGISRPRLVIVTSGPQLSLVPSRKRGRRPQLTCFACWQNMVPSVICEPHVEFARQQTRTQPPPRGFAIAKQRSGFTKSTKFRAGGMFVSFFFGPPGVFRSGGPKFRSAKRARGPPPPCRKAARLRRFDLPPRYHSE